MSTVVLHLRCEACEHQGGEVQHLQLAYTDAGFETIQFDIHCPKCNHRKTVTLQANDFKKEGLIASANV